MEKNRTHGGKVRQYKKSPGLGPGYQASGKDQGEEGRPLVTRDCKYTWDGLYMSTNKEDILPTSPFL